MTDDEYISPDDPEWDEFIEGTLGSEWSHEPFEDQFLELVMRYGNPHKFREALDQMLESDDLESFDGGSLNFSFDEEAHEAALEFFWDNVEDDESTLDHVSDR